MSALLARDHYRAGNLVEVSQVASSLQLLGPWLLQAAAEPGSVRPTGNQDPSAAPYGVYRCWGEAESWLVLAVREDEQWTRLCAWVDDADAAADRRFATAALRCAHRGDVDGLVTRWLASHPRPDGPDPVGTLAAQLQRVGVPAAACRDARDLVKWERWLHEENYLRSLPHPEMGMVTYNAPPFRLSDHSEPVLFSAPLLGEHTKEVLQDWLSHDGAPSGTDD